MRCFCCDLYLRIARKVKLRSGEFDSFDPSMGGPDSAAYKRYKEDMTFRWAFICNECYRTIDNPDNLGSGEIAGRMYNMAMRSRNDKAAVVDEAKYEKFQRAEASKLGLDY